MTKTKSDTKRAGGRLIRAALAALAAAGLVLLGLHGYRWMTTVRCERIELVGVQHADSSALLGLARVDTGLVLVDVDPDLVADRVRRHPWVRAADATRFPTGTLRIEVVERDPAALVLDGQGRPAHYLDGDGFAMPLAAGAVYDVPLLRGMREPYHPVRRVQSRSVRELLALLATLDDQTDALVSELEILPSGEMEMQTTPVGARGSIPVRLGRDGFADKLRRLDAFWREAVLTQPDKTVHEIDLRFDSQIVTREEAAGG